MSSDFEQVVSPASVAHFSQYKLISLLLKQLENLSFKLCMSNELEGFNHRPFQERQLLMGHECVSIKANDDFISVTASFLKDGKRMERNIRCNIVVGTDGAGSTVRKLAGIDMRGKRDLQKLVSVHFSSRDLGKYLLSERPGMLFFIFNTEAIGVLVAHDLKQGEFVLQVLLALKVSWNLFGDINVQLHGLSLIILQIPFYPPQQNLKDFSPKVYLLCIVDKLIVWKLFYAVS